MNLEDVKREWGDGYYEGFNAYPPGSEEIVTRLLDSYLPAECALDVGTGLGRWASQMLAAGSKQVHATDIIERSPLLPPDVQYTRVAPGDWSLSHIPNDTFDLVWCFGVLCHLPLDYRAELAQAAWHVTKPGGIAVLAFGQLQRPELFSWQPMPPEEKIPWYHDTPDLAFELCQWAGFDTERVHPQFRDTLLLCRKP